MAKKSSSNDSNIKVNTTKINAAISTLTSLNNGMETDFDSIVTAVSKMDSSWDGTASSKAISKFNKLKADCKGSSGRKAVMNQYIKFLTNNVMTDYETTEKTNTDFASMFK